MPESSGGKGIPDWNETAAQDIEYHNRQFREPYRSTVHLARFMRSVLGQPEGEALDVACGAGANIYHLSREFPGYRWTGLDIAGRVLFPVAREHFAGRELDPRWVEGDFYGLTDLFGRRSFDLVLSMQTLLVTTDYAPVLEQLLAVTRGWLVITSLLTDHRVDARIEIRDYSWPDHVQGPFYYSIYSLERLAEFCRAHGAVEVHSQDFDIDVDLPEPPTRGMGTYTRQAADGRRMQFSGPLHQPWKFVAVRMGDV